MLLKHYFFNKLKFVLATLFIIAGQISVAAQENVLVERQITLMGSVFNITVVDRDSVFANQNIDKCIAEITRIENLISEWQPQTQISEVNRNAGIKPVKVDREVFELTERAIEYSKMSEGAFDISIVALDKIWKFDGLMTEMPSDESIKNSVRNVNYQLIKLDRDSSTIYLQQKGMKIGFGSIGKGYAADKGREILQKLGIKSGIVNASGDIATWGTQPNGKPWAIGIRNPFKKHKISKILKLKHGAVATSGSYEKYAEIDGVRYSHIINPKTGFPATGLTSVTIYGSSAEFSNALSTSIMVLGKEKGKNLALQFPHYGFLFITDQGKIIR